MSYFRIELRLKDSAIESNDNYYDTKTNKKYQNIYHNYQIKIQNNKVEAPIFIGKEDFKKKINNNEFVSKSILGVPKIDSIYAKGLNFGLTAYSGNPGTDYYVTAYYTIDDNMKFSIDSVQ